MVGPWGSARFTVRELYKALRAQLNICGNSADAEFLHPRSLSLRELTGDAYHAKEQQS